MRVARISCPQYIYIHNGQKKEETLEAMIIFNELQKIKKYNYLFIYLFISGEANQLAIDFRTVCESDFPTKVTADYVARHHSDPNEISTRRNMVLAAK